MAGKKQKHPSELQGHRPRPPLTLLPTSKELEDLSELEKLTKAALVEMARARGLATSGVKADLCLRIREHAEAEAAEGLVPPLPEPEGHELKAETRRLWREIWSAAAATQWDRASDMPALVRYAWDFDNWLRYQEEAYGVEVVRGSMGQPVRNPLLGEIDACARRMEKTEEAFAMNARARLRMGVEMGDAAEGLQRADAVLTKHALEARKWAPPEGWEVANEA